MDFDVEYSRESCAYVLEVFIILAKKVSKNVSHQVYLLNLVIEELPNSRRNGVSKEHCTAVLVGLGVIVERGR